MMIRNVQESDFEKELLMVLTQRFVHHVGLPMFQEFLYQFLRSKNEHYHRP